MQVLKQVLQQQDLAPEQLLLPLRYPTWEFVHVTQVLEVLARER